VKVTRWDFAPGAETGWHRHGMDYVVTTLTPCSFLLARSADVVNGGSEPMAVEVELK
jgi:hypothetical protein